MTNRFAGRLRASGTSTLWREPLGLHCLSSCCRCSSGVMLLDLQKMRQFPWVHTCKAVVDEVLDSHADAQLQLGDQDVFNAVIASTCMSSRRPVSLAMG